MNIFLTLLLTVALALPGTAFARIIEMEVHGLVCAFCAQGIEKKLRQQPATQDVFVSLARQTVGVELKTDHDISDATLRTLLEDAGYKLVEIKRSDETLDALRARCE